MTAELRLFHPAEEPVRTARVVAMLHRSFGLPEQRLETTLGLLGRDDRVMQWGDEAEPAACVVGVRDELVGPYSNESTVFLCGAAVEPERRTGEVALKFFSAVTRLSADSGASSALLFPASWPLYSAFGFGVLANRCVLSTSMDRVVPRRVQNRAARFCPSATVTDAMLSADLGRVRAACFGHATRIARRNPLFWHAVAHQPDLKAQGYGFWRDRELVAYLIFALAGNRLVVSDYAAIDAEAMQDVIALISSFGTICERLEWVGAPGDPMHGGLQDVRVIILECQPAMVRLLDVPRHLSDRRYPASISLKTRFNVQDRLLPSNEGCYELDVSGGRAALRMDRGTLAEDVPTVEIGALSAMALAGGCASRTSGGARAAEELAAIECLFAHQCGHMPERDLF